MLHLKNCNRSVPHETTHRFFTPRCDGLPPLHAGCFDSQTAFTDTFIFLPHNKKTTTFIAAVYSFSSCFIYANVLFYAAKQPFLSLLLVIVLLLEVTVNPAMVNLFGYCERELTTKFVQDIFIEKNVFQDEMFRAVESNNISARSFEMIGVSKEGATIPVNLSIAAVKSTLGAVSGFVGIVRDVRETHRFINELKSKTKEVEQELADRKKAEAALKIAYEQLQATQFQLVLSGKMSAMGQMTAGIAHEINNPLGIILAYAQNLCKQVKKDDPLSTSLCAIEHEAKRCRDLVASMLTFSRTSSDPIRVPCDINAIIENTLTLVMSQTKISSVILIKELGKDLKKVTANPDQIQQVLMNLCTNAVDAMSGGGTLKVTSVAGDGTVEIWVSDTGTGIPRELQTRIFDPFFSTKAAGKGTGLGLSLAYEIIQKHKGKIEIESEVGKGSLFRIILPIDREG
ncbi:MAG: ATP-binding protein [Endomicrobiales bacterium]